ncbi:MAG: hypothetical protein P4K93_09645 [Terracidiphilus sp.]|nr:hypothetical protein [Terracidiphilus sp.]MDR3798405.1 hypothetical protein [Terracidiphilus sp.]
MTFNSMQHMPLTSAYLCADCHCVGNCASYCPACASGALIGLANVLNREECAEITQVSFAHAAAGSVDGVPLAA